MLEVKNLSVHYGMIQAVRNVNFKVNEGEIVSLIGANGAGKSTILKTLSGLIHPSEGEILYLGENIASTSAKKIVEKGLVQVPEGRHVFPGLTVKENLELGAFLRKDKEEIQKDIEKRDYIDSHREISPLKKASDAIEIDSSNLTIDETINEILGKMDKEDVL